MIYYVDQGNFCIANDKSCAKSNRTIDVRFFDVANNEELLRLLHLYYIVGNYGMTFTYKSRAEWFCGYISAFCHDEKKSNAKFESLIENPIVRILFEDDSLMKLAKEVI